MLEKITKLSPLIASIIVPIVLAFIGNQYTAALQKQEVNGKFVALAVDILKTKPTDQNKNIRLWATTVLDKYSGVPISENTVNDMIKTSILDVKEEFVVKDIGLEVNKDGGPLEVSVVSESGHQIDYQIELVVDGNFDTRSNNKSLVFPASKIDELRKYPKEESTAIIQIALNIKDDNSKDEYNLSILCKQDGKVLSSSKAHGKLSELGPQRTLMVDIE